MKRREYWAIEDRFGRAKKLYRDGDTIPSLDTADRWDPGGAPHRVAHLVSYSPAIETLIREAIANVDSVTSRDLREAIMAVKKLEP